MVKALRLKGAPVTAEVIISAAKGFIIAKDQSLLIGYISLSHQWDRNVLYKMEQEGRKMCRRKATTEKIPVAPGLLKEATLHFQRQIKQMHEWNQILDELIINFDQTPLSYVCSPNHTLHFKGGKSSSCWEMKVHTDYWYFFVYSQMLNKQRNRRFLLNLINRRRQK